MAFDFVVGLKCIAQPTQFQHNIHQPEAIAQHSCQWLASATATLEPTAESTELLDPWLSTVSIETISTLVQPEIKLLLPPTLALSAAPSLPATAKPSLEELLASVNIDRLQLRPARKMAKVLGVAQKVNKKDQPLPWLRAQIKAKLQQSQELDAVTIETMRGLLAS